MPADSQYQAPAHLPCFLQKILFTLKDRQQPTNKMPCPCCSAGVPLGAGTLHDSLQTLQVTPTPHTQVLCSVRDQAQSLREVRRVLKPGGKFLFLEHCLAREDQPSLRWWQNTLNPVQQALADGCNLNRDTLASVQAAGFTNVNAMRLSLEGYFVIGPHVSPGVNSILNALLLASDAHHAGKAGGST